MEVQIATHAEKPRSPKVEYIAVTRIYWSKRNGHHSFSAQVFDIHKRLILVIPIQGGDKNSAEHTVAEWVQSIRPIHEHKYDLWPKIYFDHNKTNYRDCKAFGQLKIE